ncbi:hypothetical protein PAAG_05035 [Paracoccidioides lutzii Pb01]|uniref:Uncharacterized protein n=1 Tax=Paracoccidioides lutzii (strain ATCC MYA-826 / Pb01) TaxID=502779 RepID=C1H2P2_PARBA|nr:hypothetical protein PAAG_05035 [Paracoccidioides lutzii Pb01]EEH33986.2 hypothetical protein PAAG_05035 [Paracoccidioides lutzii Pb01]
MVDGGSTPDDKPWISENITHPLPENEYLYHDLSMSYDNDISDFKLQYTLISFFPYDVDPTVVRKYPEAPLKPFLLSPNFDLPSTQECEVDAQPDSGRHQNADVRDCLTTGPLQAGMLNFTQTNYPTLSLIHQNATPSLSDVRHHARSFSVLNFEVASLEGNQIQSGPVEQEGFNELPSTTEPRYSTVVGEKRRVEENEAAADDPMV